MPSERMPDGRPAPDATHAPDAMAAPEEASGVATAERAPVAAASARAGAAVPLSRYVVVVALFLAMLPLVRMADRSVVPDKYAASVGLRELPMQVLEWSGKDYDLDDLSLELLQPDDYIWRIYQDPNGIPLDFLVVYGHLKQTFHAPDFCLPGGGWQIVAKSETPVESGGLPMRMNLFQIQRQIEGHTIRQIVMYSFVQGDKATPSLVQHNINLLRARITRERSTGALVRVVVPITSTEDAAVARAKAFISEIYPDLRQRIG